MADTPNNPGTQENPGSEDHNAGQTPGQENTGGDQNSNTGGNNQQSQEEPPASKQGKTGERSIEEFPEEAQRIIRELRNENARTRVESKETAADEARDELVKELGKLLGYESEDGEGEAPSVEDLTSQLTQERDRTKSAILELEIFRAAGSHNLDPNALLDSRNFMQQVESLDPSGKDFKDSLAGVLKDAAKDSRFVVQGQAPPRSTSELHSRRTSKDGENLSRSELADSVYSKLGGFTKF